MTDFSRIWSFLPISKERERTMETFAPSSKFATIFTKQPQTDAMTRLAELAAQRDKEDISNTLTQHIPAVSNGSLPQTGPNLRIDTNPLLPRIENKPRPSHSNWAMIYHRQGENCATLFLLAAIYTYMDTHAGDLPPVIYVDPQIARTYYSEQVRRCRRWLNAATTSLLRYIQVPGVDAFVLIDTFEHANLHMPADVAVCQSRNPFL
jgi:hypothetical protein